MTMGVFLGYSYFYFVIYFPIFLHKKDIWGAAMLQLEYAKNAGNDV